MKLVIAFCIAVLLGSSAAYADLRVQERELGKFVYQSMHDVHEQTCSCTADGNCRLRVSREELRAQLLRSTKALETMVPRLWPEVAERIHSMSAADSGDYSERLGQQYLDTLPRQQVLRWARMSSSCWSTSSEAIGRIPLSAIPSAEHPQVESPSQAPLAPMLERDTAIPSTGGSKTNGRGLYRDDSGLVFETDDRFAQAMGYTPVSIEEQAAMDAQEGVEARAAQEESEQTWGILYVLFAVGLLAVMVHMTRRAGRPPRQNRAPTEHNPRLHGEGTGRARGVPATSSTETRAEALGSGSTPSDALRHAQDLHFSKQFESAAECYARIIERWPDANEARVARQQLENLRGRHR